MRCPKEISVILAEIIGTGLFQIRVAGWAGDAGRCAAHADHLHNLPHLLTDFTYEELRTYWDIEREQFLASSDEETSRVFQPLWERLRPFAESLVDSATAS